MVDDVSTIRNGFGLHPVRDNKVHAKEEMLYELFSSSLSFTIRCLIYLSSCFHSILLPGGWWANPENWKRNTALYGVFIGVFCIWGYHYATPKTIRYEPNKESQVAPLPETHGGHH